ncbi:MAG: PepSY-associated TM helix domain-containing protein, partial [Terriglobales bacterium]
LATIQESEGRAPTNITVRADSAAPVAFDFGRERTVFVNPYSGRILGEAPRRPRAFFSAVEDVHRWLGVSGKSRSSGRAVTGACNLGFLILVISGPFLWWPKEWSWNNLKKITVFRAGPWSRARDWNWHNALGLWCVLPLFLIVITGVIMSYAWANNLLYHMTGNAPPLPGPRAVQTGAGRGLGEGGRKNPNHSMSKPGGATPQGVENLFARAGLQLPDWTTISLRLPESAAVPLTFSIDRGNGSRPDLRSQLTLDPATGKVVRWEPFSSYNRGRQLRAWARFSHTGEAGGLLGQSVAAIASTGASFLVLTGLSLGIRRFLAWKSRSV